MSPETTPAPHVEVDLQHRLGPLHLDVSIRASAPWTVLFGASGSGKSTILRAIAGLLKPDRGRIVMRGQTVLDSAAKTNLPPHKRPMRFAPQRALLFPRKTVRWQMPAGVIACGPAWVDEMDHAMNHFGLQEFIYTYPNMLSGGQRQRIAVVRAAVGVASGTAPGHLLLLDEPFTGLDAPVRDQLIHQLRAWLGDTPVLSVTHDIGEAFLLNAEVIRIAEGRVIAQGPAAEVLAEERQRLLGILKSASS